MLLAKFRFSNFHQREGFTLIELMVAIAIVGIVFGIIVSSSAAIQRSGRDAKRQSDLQKIQSALQQYYADQNYYPSSLNLTTSSAFTNCTGVSGSGCTPSKTYLNILPIETSSSTAYCYNASTNKGGGSCTNSPSNRCHYYSLFSKLENPPSGSSTYSCTGGGTGYNLVVNPI